MKSMTSKRKKLPELINILIQESKYQISMTTFLYQEYFEEIANEKRNQDN